ncbi:hypothetical protein C4544_07045 [candidate division WS5 bacterium]|uniref:YggT family protein n=1 Tax=candidate division WS5 bacterium TaxID=2093353 RepID=A0A419DAD7_9BACT|nr:MAG: hypothetical protein C4544_07045 [candidate division WS5 bacterium]
MVKSVEGKDKTLKNDPKLLKQGETFYEALPAVKTVPKELELPKIKESTADFWEGIIIFFAGTVEVLLLLRVVLMILGVSGGNLLTYLLYAVSYPFVMVLSSGQGQVPDMVDGILFENMALMVIYFVVFYASLKVIKALKSEE